jgi:NAD(P)-dependent dehydrogenase (short-subunit alcohol dehydrogenase family)
LATAVADELRKDGYRAHAVEVDVTDRVSTAAIAACAIEEFGGIDILINNATAEGRGSAARIGAI